MNAFILFLHFAGLMIGATGGFASGLLMRRAMMLPDAEARVVRNLGPLLAKVSAAGLVLLWATGLILVWSKWQGPASLPSLFWVKLVFVVALTALVGLIHLTYADIRKGNAAAAARLPKIGPLAGVSSLLAVLFAVYAFG